MNEQQIFEKTNNKLILMEILWERTGLMSNLPKTAFIIIWNRTQLLIGVKHKGEIPLNTSNSRNTFWEIDKEVNKIKGY